MRVLDTGHQYALATLDGDGEQVLTFVKREGEHYPGNIGSHSGTTMQEVIRALLERARYINAQIPCVETEAAISCLQQALLLCEIRAKRVKGKHLSAPSIALIEGAATCAKCGHVECSERH